MITTGNTELLKIGLNVPAETVEKIVFTFKGVVSKIVYLQKAGDAMEDGKYLVYLTQEDTLKLKDVGVRLSAKVLFKGTGTWVDVKQSEVHILPVVQGDNVEVMGRD